MGFIGETVKRLDIHAMPDGEARQETVPDLPPQAMENENAEPEWVPATG